ncbi:hypothetical protein HPP92_011534 [Vanilla planifolia]|uniref:EF-hand domain-containing protein n=1 Tax=Vanilla planifolia TaxID=51239 RepID=A0A835R8M5_VANPL|nr:hypothetical protein HPP92_011534 [Vanilla planifolia]
MFERNGEGSITRKELGNSLRNLSIHIPDAELQSMIDKIDANGYGYVEVNELGALYRTIMGKYDCSGGGGGGEDEEENIYVLTSLGLNQTRNVEDCRRLIQKFDVDGDGLVNYKEFEQIMLGRGFAALT